MSRARLKKRTVKISIKAKRFINAFFTVGKINAINPTKNPVNEMINKVAAKVVSVVILLNFNVNNCFF